MIIGRAPLRISFAGGGTDLEEYHKRYDGFTVSFTINKFTSINKFGFFNDIRERHYLYKRINFYRQNKPSTFLSGGAS